MKILSLIVSTTVLFIAVLAATKASVSGHLFGYLRACGILSVVAIAYITWLVLSKESKALLYRQFHFYFQTILSSVVLALALLPVINSYISSSLVSNRSYGSVIGFGIYVLLFYIGWYFMASGYSKNAT